MGYQKIKGVKVEPKGSNNRHLPNKLGYWDTTGYAFGGWIYDAQLIVGFSQAPTTIDLSIALDVQTTTPNTTNELNSTSQANAGIDFDITTGDLGVCANGGENFYEIMIGNSRYSPMFLTSYQIDGGSDTKVLKTKFIDYSIILDKIYVGLFKREGFDKQFVHTLAVTPKVDAMCPDCSLSGIDYWHVTGMFSGTIDLGSYAYFNSNSVGARKDLVAQGPLPLPNLPGSRLVFNSGESYSGYFHRRATNHVWYNQLSPLKPDWNDGQSFNINGGTLIIGTEEFKESPCGNASEISYNFSELLLSLNNMGMKFSQVNSSNLVNSWPIHVSGKIDKNPNYRQNYNGNLREVLGQWCADFGLDFYITGKTICFVDLSQSSFSAVTSLPGLMIPGIGDGGLFNSDKDFAISSYNEKCDISETYEQSIVTFDVRPRQVENQQKQIKNQCGFIAMHPLDFLGYNSTQTFAKAATPGSAGSPGSPFVAPTPATVAGHSTIYGQRFNGNYILNPMWPPISNMDSVLKNMTIQTFNANGGLSNLNYLSSAGPLRNYWYMSRPNMIVDICAALGKYSKSLKDIFVGGLVCHVLNQNPSSVRKAQLRCLTNSFGFSPLFYLNELTYAEFKQDFLEKKYDTKNQDNKQNYILNSFNFEMMLGFYTQEQEAEILEWENAIAENMYRYGALTKGNLRDFPFVTPDKTDQPGFFDGLTGIKGFKAVKIKTETNPVNQKYTNFYNLPFNSLYQSSGEFSNPLGSNMNWTGLGIAELDNQWGTSREDFEQKIKNLSVGDACNNFKQANLFSEGSESSPSNFNLEDFSPRFFPIDDDLFDDLEDELRNIVANNPAAADLLGKLIIVQKQQRTQGIPGTSKTYSQVKCPKLVLMVIPNVSAQAPSPVFASSSVPGKQYLIMERSPHLQIGFNFGVGINPVMAASMAQFLEERRLEKLKEIPKNVCDRDLVSEICNNGKPIRGGKIPHTNALPYLAPLLADCQQYSNSPIVSATTGCKCVSDYTGELWIGFESGVLTTDNCRKIDIVIEVNNPTLISKYVPAGALFTLNSKGHVKVIGDDEDFPDFEQKLTSIPIYYPIQSNPLTHNSATLPNDPTYRYYSGVMSTNIDMQIRTPEIIDVHGNYWSGNSNVSKIRQINNEIKSDISQQIDPKTRSFFKPVYDLQGNKISTVSGYHNLVTGLTLNSNKNPNFEVTFEIVGDAGDIPTFKNALTPASGMTSLSYSLTSEGYRTNVTFASKPPKPPNPEAILNKIRPRM